MENSFHNSNNDQNEAQHVNRLSQGKKSYQAIIQNRNSSMEIL